MAPKNANAGLSITIAAIIDNCAHMRRLKALLLADTGLGFSRRGGQRASPLLHHRGGAETLAGSSKAGLVADGDAG